MNVQWTCTLYVHARVNCAYSNWLTEYEHALEWDGVGVGQSYKTPYAQRDVDLAAVDGRLLRAHRTHTHECTFVPI